MAEKDSFGGTIVDSKGKPIKKRKKVEGNIGNIALDVVEAVGKSFIDEGKVNPTQARVIGGLTGATLALPVAPPFGSLAGGALMAEGFGQAADVYNMFLVDGIRDTLTRFPTPEEGRAVLHRGVKAANNVAIDLALNLGMSGFGRVLRSGWKRIFTKDFNEAAGISTKELAGEFREAAVKPPAGAFGTKGVQTTQKALEGLPPSVNTMSDDALKTFNQLSKNAEDILESTGKITSAEVSGDAIRTALSRDGGYIGQALAESSRLVQRVQEVMPSGTMIKVTNYVKHINGIMSGLKNLQSSKQELLAPKFKNFYDDSIREIVKKDAAKIVDVSVPQLGHRMKISQEPTVPEFLTVQKKSGELTFNEVAKFRTHIGDLRGTPHLGEGLTKKNLKAVYKSLTLDLAASAKAQGGEVFERWKASQKFTSDFYDNLEIMRHIADSDTGAQAFNLMSNPGSKGPKALKIVRQMVNKINPGAWKDYVSTNLYKMSRATAGRQTGVEANNFSISTMLKNYSKMKENGSANILFKGQPGLKKEWDRLIRISSALKDVEKVANTSNTAPISAFQRIIQGGVLPAGVGLGYAATHFPIAAGSAAFALITPYGLGKLYTNKTFINWLGSGIKISPSNFNSIRTHLTRLAVIKRQEPEIAGPINELMDSLNRSYEFSKKQLLTTGVASAGNEKN